MAANPTLGNPAELRGRAIRNRVAKRPVVAPLSWCSLERDEQIVPIRIDPAILLQLSIHPLELDARSTIDDLIECGNPEFGIAPAELVKRTKRQVEGVAFEIVKILHLFVRSNCALRHVRRTSEPFQNGLRRAVEGTLILRVVDPPISPAVDRRLFESKSIVAGDPQSATQVLNPGSPLESDHESRVPGVAERFRAVLPGTPVGQDPLENFVVCCGLWMRTLFAWTLFGPTLFRRDKFWRIDTLDRAGCLWQVAKTVEIHPHRVLLAGVQRDVAEFDLVIESAALEVERPDAGDGQAGESRTLQTNIVRRAAHPWFGFVFFSTVVEGDNPRERLLDVVGGGNPRGAVFVRGAVPNDAGAMLKAETGGSLWPHRGNRLPGTSRVLHDDRRA